VPPDIRWVDTGGSSVKFEAGYRRTVNVGCDSPASRGFCLLNAWNHVLPIE